MTLRGQPQVLLAADAVEHLELVLVQFAPGLVGQLLGDRYQSRVVGPDHRVALALHQRPEDAHVGLVDLVLLLVGDLGGLLVGALHQAHAAAGGGETAGVGLGTEEVGLDDAAGLREVLPQLLVDGEHRVQGGVVLGVQRDGRTDGGGGLDDGPDVGERQLVSALQGLAEHGQLDRHLDLPAELQLAQPVDQLEVGVPGGKGLLRGGDVLADDVHRQLQAPVRQVLDDRDDVGNRLTRDEAVDDLLGHRGRRDKASHPVAARRGENHGTQHGAPPQQKHQKTAESPLFGYGTGNHRET